MQTLVFAWNNFGPMHADRVDAVANAFPQLDCIGLEILGAAPSYDWVSETRESFSKVTLFPDRRNPGSFSRLYRLLGFALRKRRSVWFLCHYERLDTLLLTLFLRLCGRQVYMMADSKFDDLPRSVFREAVKSVFVRPYSGALACGDRSRDYLRFLGQRSERIATEYDTLSVERILSLSEAPQAPDGIPFADRDFIMVARHVPKKNIQLALQAFHLFQKRTDSNRKLHLCGSGPLTEELKAQVAQLGLTDHVVFHGFVQTDAVARLLGRSLALILPSVEEQFGLVVIEAQATGLPVIVSIPCGARDKLVRSWVNGFVFEPDNAEGLAGYMALIDADESLWRRLCEGARDTAPAGDVGAFVNGVAKLTRLSPNPVSVD